MSDTLTRDSYEPSGPYGLFVGGEEIAGDAEFAALDPSTGEQWATVAEASADQVDFAVGTAVKAFRGWRRSTLEERQRILLAMADRVEGGPRVAGLLAAEKGRAVRGGG